MQTRFLLDPQIDTSRFWGYSIGEVRKMQIRYEKLQPGQGHTAGRRLLAQMYREITGKPLPEIAIAPGGKPYFPDGSLHFSISHTKRHVFCAVSDRPVGIDAEEIDRKIDLRLADKILSDTEKVHFENATDKRLTLLKFWVLKEAAAKLSGKGLQGYPNKTDFSPDDPRITVIDNCLVAVME